ncbi:MAG: DNA polymerase IV [Thermoanaerobacterales bacterium]|nr:DNA polymerase IV [Thermoanaerobacterales bacterium]
MDRTILHCDMNNCYASIEIKLHPEWKGKPLAVCGSQEDRHGIVLAKSQEAKAFGIKTGEVIWQAKQKCPDLLIVPPHYDEYLKHSRLAQQIYYSYSNQVESFGLDECWIDVSGSKLFGDGKTIADEIRSRIKKELGITVSVGVSFNKVFAKLGSDMKKPDATTVITKQNFKEIVWRLPTSEMIGIGKATAYKLKRCGINTLGDLANTDPDFLKRLLGINGVALWNYANGRDNSRVSDYHYKAPIKTIGHGITCRQDLINEFEVKRIFHELSQDVSKRLIDNGLLATGVQITVRDNELYSKQYQMPTKYPTYVSMELTETAMELFRKNYDWKNTIRSLTIRAIGLMSINRPYQLHLLDDIKKHERLERLENTIYDIRKKYGKRAISYASLLGDIKMPKQRTDVVTLPNFALKQGNF